MYMTLCLEYKISRQEQSELFFNMKAITGHMGACQVMSSHKPFRTNAIVQLLKYLYEAIHTFKITNKGITCQSHVVSYIIISSLLLWCYVLLAQRKFERLYCDNFKCTGVKVANAPFTPSPCVAPLLPPPPPAQAILMLCSIVLFIIMMLFVY